MVSFPPRVYFLRNPERTAERERDAVSGFKEWESATGGFVSLEVVEDSSNADVTVAFDPTSSNGATTNSFSRGVMIKAQMKIGVKGSQRVDVTCVAAHEFGHALGLTGHSEDRKDLMYPYHWMGKGCGISRRDLNTLSSRYPALAARLERAKSASH